MNDRWPILALRDVRRTHPPAWTLSIASLDVKEGEVLGIIGPNGSGKSTVLRLLGLLEAPDAGEVRFRGEHVTVTEGLAARRRMATVFQQTLLVDGTVEDNVGLGLGFRGVPATERARRVGRWLEHFGISDTARRPATTLSGGQARRVALARALALDPEVLLLDEPFAGLDEPTRAELLPELGAILRRERMTTVLVTHDRGEAQALADRVAVLLDGRVHQVDETARVFLTPVSEDVARFVGVETIVSGVILMTEGGLAVVEVAGRRLEVAATARPGQHVRLGIRPEDVTLAQPRDGSALSSARNQLSGTVLSGTVVRVAAGSPVRVLVDVGFPLLASVTARSVAELGLRPGTPVAAIFKASAVHLVGGASS